MSFIRRQMAAQYYVGDPFRFRVPKFLKPPKALRKLTLGKVLKAAQPFASFIPGVGSVLSMIPTGGGAPAASMLPEYAAAQAAPEPTYAPPPPVYYAPPPAQQEYYPQQEAPVMIPPELMAYARSFGIELGDPGPRPVKAHAAAKAGVQSARTMRKVKPRRGAPSAVHPAESAAHGSSARGKVPARQGQNPLAGLGAIGAGLQQRIAGALTQLRSGNLPAAAAQAVLGTGGPVSGLQPWQHKRRSMNPTNVRALRRSIRRVEGFQNVVKRVYKMFPAMKPQHKMIAAGGHRSGCKCATCKGR